MLVSVEENFIPKFNPLVGIRIPVLQWKPRVVSNEFDPHSLCSAKYGRLCCTRLFWKTCVEKWGNLGWLSCSLILTQNWELEQDETPNGRAEETGFLMESCLSGWGPMDHLLIFLSAGDVEWEGVLWGSASPVRLGVRISQMVSIFNSQVWVLLITTQDQHLLSWWWLFVFCSEYLSTSPLLFMSRWELLFTISPGGEWSPRAAHLLCVNHLCQDAPRHLAAFPVLLLIAYNKEDTMLKQKL